MSWGNFLYDKGFDIPVSASITKYRAVKLTGVAEEVNIVTGDTDKAIGFPQYSVSAAEQTRGKGASVRVMGVTQAEAAGAIAIGDVVTLANAGDGTVSSNTTGNRIVGICVGSPSTNAGDRIALLINVFGGVA